ncbi:MAG: hypothetical protein AAFV53_04915 [Myxococcota bacterium]
MDDTGASEWEEEPFTGPSCDAGYTIEAHPKADDLCVSGVAAFLDDEDTFSTIASAISAAGGEVVYLCPGTHTESLSISAPTTLAAASGDATDTILDGGGTQRLLVVSAETELYNLTFQNGYHSYDGGAITSTDTLSVYCSVFLDNTADYEGGGISARGDLNLYYSRFDNNYADYEGGGVQWADWDPFILTIEGCEFVDNDARYEGGGLAIGSWAEGDEIAISDSLFEGNTTGISVGTWGNATLTISDSNLIENDGAGLYLGGWSDSYDVSVSDVTFDGNDIAIAVGGRVVEATLELIDSSILNSALTTHSAIITTSAVDLISEDTDWGTTAGGDDNAGGDLNSPCGRYTTLGDRETFRCEGDGTWTP